ncbi:MAG: rRNA maturation RNase YbeY [Alphaproteobacteria bacterium]
MIPNDTAEMASPRDAQGWPAGLVEDIEIDILVQAPAWRAVDDLAAIARAAVHQTLRTIPLNTPAMPTEISLVFADADFVAALNKTHRGKSGPTNVLSFPGVDPGDVVGDVGVILLGDVVLAFEVVAAQAKAGEIALAHHTAHLLVHGILHLLGYDHILDKDAQIMEALEIGILEHMKITNPYATDTRK